MLISWRWLDPSWQDFVPGVGNAVEHVEQLVYFLIRHDATVQVRLLAIDDVCVMSYRSWMVNSSLVIDWNPRADCASCFLHMSCLSGALTAFEEREVQIVHLADDALSDVETSVNIQSMQQRS